jgi:Tol biopolymer transport system component/DNA-binding winged helix-turn-helix (wHTH) protein
MQEDAPPTAVDPQDPIRIAGRDVQPALYRILTPEGTVQQVEPRVMAVLLCLVASAGRVVTREELIDQVWDGHFVSDDVLTRAIAQLRRLFGDDAAQPAVIETIRKRGYRLLVAPEPLQRAVPEPAPAPASVPTERPVRTRGVFAAGLLLGLVVVVIIAAIVNRRVDRPVEPSRLVPVVTPPSTEIRRPHLSPDGTRIAYAAQTGTGREFHIAVVLLNGGDALALTRPPPGSFDLPLAWSPDGSELAYGRLSDGHCEVRIVPTLGGPDRVFGPCGDADEPSLTWSLDGKWLVESWGARQGVKRLRIEAVDGSQPARDLTTPSGDTPGDSDPVFSPDGSLIVFNRSLAVDVGDLWVVPFSGGAERRVTFDHASVIGADWLPDGHTLVFSSSRAGINSLWEVDAEGGSPRFLTGASPKIKHPSAARTTPRIVFESWDYEINLHHVEIPSGTATAIAATPDWTWSPAYSPAGTELAFLSTRSGATELWAVKLPDGAPRQLTHFGGPQLADPAWSPDGRSIAFVARPEGNALLETVPVDGGAVHALSTGSTDSVQPSFSHDGRALYFAGRTTGPWAIQRLDLSAGSAVRLIDGGFTARESADGTRLWYTRADRPGLFEHALDAAPGVVDRRIATLLPAGAQPWQVTNTGVVVDVEAHDLHRLEQVDASTTRALVTLPEMAWKGFSVRFDGREAVYAHLDRHTCHFVLLDHPPHG